MNKRCGEVLVVLLCITILAGYVRKDDLLEDARGHLVTALSSALGQQVEFESGQWSISPIPYLEFNNISVGDIDIASLRVDLSKEALIRKQVIPIAIRMKRGRLNYERMHQLVALSEVLPDNILFVSSEMKLVDDFRVQMGSINIVDNAKLAGYQNCRPLKRQYLCVSGQPDKIALNHHQVFIARSEYFPLLKRGIEGDL